MSRSALTPDDPELSTTSPSRRPVRRSQWAAILCAACLCLGTTGLTGRARLPAVDAAAAPATAAAQASALAAEEPD